MLIQLATAAAVSICNIMIHALFMTVVVRSAQVVGNRKTGHPTFRLAATMVATVSVLMAAHTAEIGVWAFAFGALGVAPAGTDFMYFAFVNYTTLGYGDVLPVQQWKLLGPAAAMNGVLLFGWSTAVIFEVLRRAMLED